MKKPLSTYRLQLSPEFSFDDLEEVLDYLERLGISTIYAAPIFQARENSSHGYDVVDPHRINRQVGRLDDLRRIGQSLRQKKMTWLQDIVPNHMAYDADNIWLRDIFELGPRSAYYNFFDIDWTKENGKVMAPFLGAPLEEVMQKKELQVKRLKSGFYLSYFDHNYPVSADSYPVILAGKDMESWKKKFSELSGEKEDWQELKEFLFRSIHSDPDLEQRVEKHLDQINASTEKLQEILSLQYFLPTFWKKTEQEINYRRFFTINDLICLRMENQEVFENYHRFIFDLCEENMIHGLRIDHIDGLFDPRAYLESLRKELGDDFYLVAEKIMESDEHMPEDWPLQGSSGYDFLALSNQLFTKASSLGKFSQAYAEISPEHDDFRLLVYRQKLFILRQRMGGEFDNLWQLALERNLIDHPDEQTKQALGIFLAGFPVYRIYPQAYPLGEQEQAVIEKSFKSAAAFSPEHQEELELIKDLFLGRAEKPASDMLFFLQRSQQYTGPLSAKGMEDTSFYIYNRLISHNEVGDSPENFGLSVPDFHKKMQLRLRDFPGAINASATHDTKRGEDARMRINVLSELPEEWLAHYKNWKSIARQTKKDSGPDANEEYFIYQMLLGAWPFQGDPGKEFLERAKAYLMKVLREAKINSSWAMPDENYEQKVFNFVEFLVFNEDFKSAFLPFQQKVSAYGAVKSLAQTLLKITAPGVPDLYQGGELWDLSFVDPDNRRPVNYSKRKQWLSEITDLPQDRLQETLSQLKQDYSSGKIKLFCSYKALNLRMDLRKIFEEGDYLPLSCHGRFRDSLLAFCRSIESSFVLVVIPVLVTELFDSNLELKEDLLEEEVLSLPQGFPRKWHNTLSGSGVEGDLKLGDLFADFPVALMSNLDQK